MGRRKDKSGAKQPFEDNTLCFLTDDNDMEDISNILKDFPGIAKVGTEEELYTHTTQAYEKDLLQPSQSDIASLDPDILDGLNSISSLENNSSDTSLTPGTIINNTNKEKDIDPSSQVM